MWNAKCEVCGCPATVHITNVGVAEPQHLCEAHKPKELLACDPEECKPAHAGRRELDAKLEAMMVKVRRGHFEKVIADLERFRREPAAFIPRVDVPDVQAFLNGFVYALQASRRAPHAEAARAALAAQGYADEPTGLVPQMKHRGMDERAIMDALVALEIDAFRRQLVTDG